MWELWMERLHPEDAARVWAYVIRFRRSYEHPYYASLRSIRSRLLAHQWPARILQQQRQQNREQREKQLLLLRQPHPWTTECCMCSDNSPLPSAESILLLAFKASDLQAVRHFSLHIPMVVTVGTSVNPTLGFRPLKDSVIKLTRRGTGVNQQQEQHWLKTWGPTQAEVWKGPLKRNEVRTCRIKLFGSGKGVGELKMRISEEIHPFNGPYPVYDVPRTEFTLGRFEDRTCMGYERKIEVEGVTVWIGAPSGLLGCSKLSDVEVGRYGREFTFHLQQ